ncbi:ABC-three component system protein [Filibacter tadaridae]|uniref:ABC-three component systems C-terminal domain-containing protein n=1 Tax=Filibacter tadaridae TaxID=2483811 RepID=A0A3P5XCB9_9BACL|nr:ABC-three component system protein [Filibacter tadaridae]VDC25154.1 hypothetical protein FILTAD_01191 [Filibacter tadaridae]
MNSQEKTILRIMFKNKIYKCDGQAFEDLFTSVMNYAEKDFKSIKPWGNIGDRKNDGYVKQTGTYYQVFAPEEIEKSYPNTVKKLHTDFNGLIEQWSPVNSFYFVINDKYKGVNADAEQEIEKIKEVHGLENAAILTAKDVENTLFELEEDQIFSIVGMLPDPGNIKNIDYSILNEVIAHIMELPLQTNVDGKMVLPDWDDKIQFNHLSDTVAGYLNTASYQLYNLEAYLSDNSSFVADTLRDKMNEVYQQEKTNKSGDQLFMAMVQQLTPKQTQPYQNTVIIVMAKYFETCDIFEEPKEEEER